jgi:hypothetical protein
MEEQNTQQDNLTAIGQLFFGSVLAWITRGTELHFKVKGKPEEVQAFTNVAFASKKFQEEVANPSATIESVMQKLNTKNLAAVEYEKVTGQRWPL